MSRSESSPTTPSTKLIPTKVPYLNVVPFEPLPNPYQESAVKVLKGILEDAEAGKIASVFIATMGPCGGTGGNWSECDDTALMLGAVEMVKHRMINQMDEDEPEEPEAA